MSTPKRGWPRQRTCGAVLIAAVAVLVSGCADGTTAPKPWLGEVDFKEQITEIISEATVGGASDQQLELLIQAESEGHVSYDATKVAVLNVIECFSEFGGEGVYEDMTLATNYVVPGYTVAFDQNLGETAIESFIDICEVRESYWVRNAYQRQPSSRELIGQHVMSKEDELRECLEGHGLTTDPQDTGWDLALVALEVLVTTDHSIDCWGEAGIQAM